MLQPPSYPRATYSAADRIASCLPAALARGEITTSFQPKVRLADGRLVGMEALARWTSPALGIVPPDRFIPVAEQRGLIAALTQVVLREALAMCARLRHDHAGLTVAVNISPVLLGNPELADQIAKALAVAELPASALIAEITEGHVIADPQRAGITLGVLRARGVACAIDDFGTGHASLLTLLRLPFSELKIDRAFIADCATDSEAEKIVRATIGLAREMGLNVVAEGIETAQAERKLRVLGCAVGQGFRYGHAVDGLTLRRLGAAAILAGAAAMPQPRTDLLEDGPNQDQNTKPDQSLHIAEPRPNRRALAGGGHGDIAHRKAPVLG